MPIQGLQDLRSIAAQGPAGMTYDMRTGQAVGMGTNTGGGSYTDQPYTGVSPTIRANQAAMGYLAPGYKPSTTPVAGQMTWDQWAQNMQNQYGVSNPGTLGGTSGGTVPPAGANGSGNNTNVYPAGYTGYGNSNIGNGQPTNSTNAAPPGTTSTPTAPTPNNGGNQVQGGMNAVQQLINGGAPKPQVGIPAAPQDPQFSTATNPQPFSNVSTNPYPTVTTQPVPVAPPLVPVGGFKPSNSLYNNTK